MPDFQRFIAVSIILILGTLGIKWLHSCYKLAQGSRVTRLLTGQYNTKGYRCYIVNG